MLFIYFLYVEKKSIFFLMFFFGILSVKNCCLFCIDDGCVIFCVVDDGSFFMKIVDGDDGDVVRNYSRSFRIYFLLKDDDRKKCCCSL